MTTEEQMTIDERYKYLQIMQKKYNQAQTRREKQELLNHMELATGLQRKYLIQLMREQPLKRHPRRKEREKS